MSFLFYKIQVEFFSPISHFNYPFAQKRVFILFECSTNLFGIIENIFCMCVESGDDEPVWSGRLHETKHDVRWGMCVRMVER